MNEEDKEQHPYPVGTRVTIMSGGHMGRTGKVSGALSRVKTQPVKLDHGGTEYFYPSRFCALSTDEHDYNK